MSLLLGLDLGTSYFKAGLFDAAGTLRGLGRVRVERDEPAPGRSELPVDRFWATLRQAIAGALAEAQAVPADIATLSYSSQASTFLLLDAADRPLTPFIIWNDSRGEPAVPELSPLAATEEFRRAIGWDSLSGMNALCKWRALQQRDPELWRRTRRIMTIPDYLTFTLTGERAGDGGTAAFLGTFDLLRGTWWAPALAAAGIDPALLSQPLLPGTRCGATTRAATEHLGLPAGRPYAVGSLDHHVAAIGAGLGTFADVSISTGTVLAALALTQRIEPGPGRFYGQHVAAPLYYCLTYDAAGAGQLEDYQRVHAPDLTIPQLLDQAALARPPASSTDHGSAVLAMLESVGRSQRRLAQAAAGSAIRTIVATGGGARSPLWVQVQADIFNLPVATVASPEPGCLGAAVLAAAAAGIHGTLANASDAMVRPGRVFAPLEDHAARYAR